MSSPCLSNEFALDEGGRVEIDLCGPPAQQDWPFTCSARQNNGLHRNEDGCLWVTPQASGAFGVLSTTINCGAFCTYSTSQSVYGFPIVSLSVTNPDLCRSRDYLIHTDYSFRVTPAATPTLTQFYRQVVGVDGADAGWTLVYTADSGVTAYLRIATSDVWTIKGLEPGASRTVKIGMRVNSSLGSGNLDSVTARAGGVGIASA